MSERLELTTFSGRPYEIVFQPPTRAETFYCVALHKSGSVLFDNIVSDWMVKDRISQARTRAKDLHRRLSRLSDELGTETAQIAARITELQRRREEILTTT